ncbi:MAG: hypothetical protein DHS20C02_18700 [Micavibrio sp.]|nr:MAG: hypothetical protein DHS20C02_18700 [Micavibrio sp.]
METPNISYEYDSQIEEALDVGDWPLVRQLLIRAGYPFPEEETQEPVTMGQFMERVKREISESNWVDPTLYDIANEWFHIFTLIEKPLCDHSDILRNTLRMFGHTIYIPPSPERDNHINTNYEEEINEALSKEDWAQLRISLTLSGYPLPLQDSQEILSDDGFLALFKEQKFGPSYDMIFAKIEKFLRQHDKEGFRSFLRDLGHLYFELTEVDYLAGEDVSKPQFDKRDKEIQNILISNDFDEGIEAAMQAGDWVGLKRILILAGYPLSPDNFGMPENFENTVKIQKWFNLDNFMGGELLYGINEALKEHDVESTRDILYENGHKIEPTERMREIVLRNKRKDWGEGTGWEPPSL